MQVSEQNKLRIEELKQREVTLNAEIAQHQKQISLAEKFQRRKIKAIEDEINAKFDIIKFKMLEVCINGTIKEICASRIERGIENSAKARNSVPRLIFKSDAKILSGTDAQSYTSNSL